jgi:hypothetical protein
VTNQPGYYDDAELSIEDQEAQIRTDCALNIDDMIQRESIKFLRQTPRRFMSVADEKSISDSWNQEADEAIATLRAAQEKLTGPCYLQQERKEASASQETKSTDVFKHRYTVIPPNSLGPYTLGYTSRNREGANKLMIHLDKVLWTQNEERPATAGISYKCRYCSRSLYVPPSQKGKEIHCTCWKCISVLYCSPTCRDLDKDEHRMSCFVHPGWECKEAEKQRAIMAIEASKSVQEARVAEEKSEVIEQDVDEGVGSDAQNELESEPAPEPDPEQQQGQLQVQPGNEMEANEQQAEAGDVSA